MKNSTLLVVGAAMLSLSACNNRTSNETTHTDSTVTTTTTHTSQPMAANDAMYNKRADEFATKLNTELKLDTMQQRRARTTFYNRTRRYGDLQTRYSTDTTGMYNDWRTIDRETDTELKSYLRPEQYTSYERNRTSYMDDMDYYNSSNADTSSTMGSSNEMQSNTNAQMNSDNSKMKVEGDEAKYKSGDTKMKTKGEETKYKSGNTKVKVNP